MRHGGPYDRGAADSYYHRPRNPHFYRNRTYLSERVSKGEMTLEEIKEYHRGYSDNEKLGEFKDYGFAHDYDHPDPSECEEETEND